MAVDTKAWTKKYLQPLVGATITRVGGDFYDRNPDTDNYPFFEVGTPSGETYKCEISRDEEGNGVGFLFGLPSPQ